MTSDGSAGDRPQPVTYNDALQRYRPQTHAAIKRCEELSWRDEVARAEAGLRARGQYDPAKYGTGDSEPLSRDEHLELLATLEYPPGSTNAPAPSPPPRPDGRQEDHPRINPARCLIAQQGRRNLISQPSAGEPGRRCGESGSFLVGVATFFPEPMS